MKNILFLCTGNSCRSQLAHAYLDFFGKDEKVPYSARNIFFVLANAGCLFLASGIIQENSFLIKCGIFILITQALVDAHLIISKYARNSKVQQG